MAMDEGQPPPRSVSALISVCCSRDAEVWRETSKHIVKYIRASRYEVIIPDREIDMFTTLSPKSFAVVGESTYVKDRNLDWLRSFFPEKRLNRAGWYLQQFVKIAAAKSRPNDDTVLIWDGDTVPLRPLEFIDRSGKLIYYTGSEHHLPYFAMIRHLLGLEKIVSFSFIAQCFIVKSQWADDFCNEIERHHNKHWIDAIVGKIDFDTESSFSEYESLGTYLSHRHPDEFLVSRHSWEREGNSLIGGIQKLTDRSAAALGARYDFISFEKWDVPRIDEYAGFWRV
jgi:uncharacterized protein DUF6492